VYVQGTSHDWTIAILRRGDERSRPDRVSAGQTSTCHVSDYTLLIGCLKRNPTFIKSHCTCSILIQILLYWDIIGSNYIIISLNARQIKTEIIIIIIIIIGLIMTAYLSLSNAAITNSRISK